MKKVKQYFSLILMTILGVSLVGCDFGINDFEFTIDEIKISDVLNTRTCYTDLLEDLEYLKKLCDNLEKNLIESHSFKILISYGIADISFSKTPSNNINSSKALLYARIKDIYILASSQSQSVLESISVLNAEAIFYCQTIIFYLDVEGY